MIEKSVMIIIFMYSVSFSLVGVQWMYADILGIQLKNPQGQVIKTPIIDDVIKMDNVNTATANIVNATDAENSTLAAVENAFQIGFNVGKDIIVLITGTYVFNLLYLMGVPPIFIVPMVVLYALMVGRTLIAYIRGV